jgi:hypothetical protein
MHNHLFSCADGATFPTICQPFLSPQGHASEAMSLYLQLSKLGPSTGSTSSAALAKLARAAAAEGDAQAIQLLQKQLPGELDLHSTSLAQGFCVGTHCVEEGTYMQLLVCTCARLLGCTVLA